MMETPRACRQIFCAVLLSTAATYAVAQQYAPKDLYEYEALTLDNGLRVILNDRGQSPNVAIRLVVETGMNDFPCPERELPHLVEHLMFSGYGDVSESEMDAMVADWGGEWNAFTQTGRTTYEIDVYSDFLDDATLLLNRMFSETEITREELDNARVIVDAEAGGAPGGIRQILYKLGLYEGNEERAYRRFVRGSNEWCESLYDARSIALDDVVMYMSTEHRPANMVLVVVGRFDAEAYKSTLARTFGAMARGSGVSRKHEESSIQFIGASYNTRTDILLGQEGYACLEFGLPKWTSAERPALLLTADYLDTRMFETLRTEMGLSYDPEANLNDFEEFSTLMLDATVASGDIDAAMEAMEGLVRELLEDGIPEDWLDHLKRSALYGAATSYESNASIADFYESNLERWEANGEFPNLDTFYGDVTAEDTRAIARKYLDPDKALRYTSKPTLSYAGAVAILMLPLVAVVAFRVSRKKTKK
jgi:predicted Zn-dependent peptidase